MADRASWCDVLAEEFAATESEHDSQDGGGIDGCNFAVEFVEGAEEVSDSETCFAEDFEHPDSLHADSLDSSHLDSWYADSLGDAPGVPGAPACEDLEAASAPLQERVELYAAKCKSLEAKVRKLQQTTRRQRKKVDVMEQKLVAGNANANPTALAFDTSKRYQSLPTIMGTAFRRCAGHASLRSSVVLTGAVVSHQTIRTWEIKAAASLVSEFRSFHAANEQRIRELPPEDWFVGTCLHKADATNTIGNMSQSFQTMKCRSRYNFSGDEDVHELYPDAQAVVDKTADGCIRLVRKQWRCIKFPWECPLILDRGSRAYRWAISCTDAGGDQKATRNYWKAEMGNWERELFIDTDCQHHVTSNGNKEMLLQGDVLTKSMWDLPFAYFGSMGKLANTVNFNMAKIKKTARRVLPEEEAKQLCEALRVTMPKPIATRWGTSGDSEKYTIDLPAGSFVTVFVEVFEPKGSATGKGKRGSGKGKSKKGKGKAGKQEGGNVDLSQEKQPLDEMAIEQCEYFSERKSRWAKDSCLSRQVLLLCFSSHHRI